MAIIAVGNKIELESLDDVILSESKKRIYISKIYDILPGGKIQIAMPICDGKIVPLPVNEKYSACFYTSKGLQQANIIISARYKSGNLFFLEILLLTELSKVQRRSFYRYKCVIDGKIRSVSEREFKTGRQDDMSLPEDLLDWDDVRILDISGGGVRLIEHKSLEKNEFVKLKFAVSILDEILMLNLYGKILSSTKYKDKANIYQQRVEFLKVSKEDRDKIIRYIFENERMARAKEVGLKK